MMETKKKGKRHPCSTRGCKGYAKYPSRMCKKCQEKIRKGHPASNYTGNKGNSSKNSVNKHQ